MTCFQAVIYLTVEFESLFSFDGVLFCVKNGGLSHLSGHASEFSCFVCSVWNRLNQGNINAY